MNRRLQRPLSLSLVSLFMLCVWVLSGCEERQENEDQLSFQFALPDGWQIVNADHTGRVTRLDTNSDGDNEWVLLYSFDVPGDQAFTPIRCAIYHSVRREPRLPVIYPYHLQAPGWTYLGEGAGSISVRVEDVVTNVGPEPPFPEGTYFSPTEVIVEDRGTSGQITRASIFQWRNTVVPPENRKRIDPQEHIVTPLNPLGADSQWYQCIGLFEGTVQVIVGKDEVIVSDRLNDRSQLARVNTYKPDAGMGGYLYGGQDLVPAVSSCVDFAFGMPSDVDQSPYPEKVVMAFHHQFTSQADNYGADLLTENAQHARQTSPIWSVFVPGRQPPVNHYCMKTLRYGQEIEAEIRSFSPPEGQEPPPITTQVETWAEYYIEGQPIRQTRFVWQLVKKETAWKIDGILATMYE